MTEHRLLMPRSQELINYAYEYAKEAHGSQMRKYTDEPYIVHPVAVAHIVMTTNPDCEMVCAALLHDVIEDTDVTYEDIRDAGFQAGIANLVLELTDVSKPEDGNRKVRKLLDRNHLAGASNRAKTIKLADCLHNGVSIVKYDSNFAKVYMKEMEMLVPLLNGGDNVLFERANRMLIDYYLRRLQ